MEIKTTKKLATVVTIVLLVGVAAWLSVYQNRRTQPVATVQRTCYIINPDSILNVSANPQISENFIADSNCRTLYVFSSDKPNESTCYDECAKTLIPYLEKTTKSNLPPINNSPKDNLSPLTSTIKRTDGSMQYAYKGQPLYYYVGDKKPGEVNGQNVNNTWTIIPTTEQFPPSNP